MGFYPEKHRLHGQLHRKIFFRRMHFYYGSAHIIAHLTAPFTRGNNLMTLVTLPNPNVLDLITFPEHHPNG